MVGSIQVSFQAKVSDVMFVYSWYIQMFRKIVAGNDEWVIPNSRPIIFARKNYLPRTQFILILARKNFVPHKNFLGLPKLNGFVQSFSGHLSHNDNLNQVA
ncbi:MAG: hypothetical protein DRR19_30055 [Candidatus Parabeggiatoa sp. nov. 1]|nr:MAG: hypothetical protein DRR19_30055 [Gammaproteobacteria bacterium]